MILLRSGTRGRLSFVLAVVTLAGLSRFDPSVIPSTVAAAPPVGAAAIAERTPTSVQSGADVSAYAGTTPGGVVATVRTAPGYKLTAYTIRTLPPGALPYVGSTLPSKLPPAPHDADGIPMRLVGSRLTYNPTGLMQYGLQYEDAYRRTHDPDYLAIAHKVLAKVMAMGTRSNGGVYLPYMFNFAMHGIPTEVMRAPWYSAMAQGLALSLAVRLHRDTGDPSYLAQATLLFRSFQHVGRSRKPWVTYIDAGRYLWLEEYPERTTPSDHTANGFNFALFGLYDYYEESHDPLALRILRAGLTTMRHYIGQFRRPGTYSKYCLRHGKPSPKYHRIVTSQLVFLYKMSGDPYFLSMSRAFARDHR